MKHLSISVFLIVCLVILVIKVTAQQQESLYRGSEHRHANFVKHPRTFLDVSPIAIKRVHDALYCAFNCLRKGRCFSFNVAVFPDADGKYECQLLATDKCNSSDNLKSTKEFNHHSILVRPKLRQVYSFSRALCNSVHRIPVSRGFFVFFYPHFKFSGHQLYLFS